MSIFSYQTTILMDSSYHYELLLHHWNSKRMQVLIFLLVLVIIALVLIFNILRVIILTKFQNQFFHVKSIKLGNLARSESNLSLYRFRSDKSMQNTIFCRTRGPAMVQRPRSIITCPNRILYKLVYYICVVNSFLSKD